MTVLLRVKRLTFCNSVSEHKRNGDNGDVQVVLVRKMKKSWEGLGLRWENVN